MAKKAEAEQLPKIPPIRLNNKRVPKTPNQEDYVISLAENPITICVGPAGTGK